MTLHDEGPGAPRVLDRDAYAALLRREQQVDAIQHSLGWRLLSFYGPYKRRFVLPLWRRLRARMSRWFGATRDPPVEAYERWARFADRFRTIESTAVEPPEMVSILMIIPASSDLDCAPAVASIIAQQHQAWELLIATSGNPGRAESSPVARQRRFGPDDARIHVDEGHYVGQAAAITALVGHARGGIVTVIGPDVALAPDALRVVVDAFHHTACGVLYSDEDHRDDRGTRHGPRFLPAWSPDLLLSEMYWSHATFYRRDVLTGLMPLDPDLDGAHAYDLALKVTERKVEVAHVPRVLAHVRAARLAPGAQPPGIDGAAGERALARALARRGVDAKVDRVGPRAFRVRRAILSPARVSIIIPTRDGFGMLRRCLTAVERSQHPDFEVLIVDNGSRDRATLALLAATRHRVLRAPGPFNFSRLNNEAVREATGRYLLFLNDDTEPLDPTWLGELEEHAQRSEVGAVGAKLLYSDDRIQHAGVAVGVGGIAGHPYRFRRHAPGSVRNVSAVTAACLMVRRDVFEEVGGFDERLPINSNDVDLCLRVRARGLLVVYTPYAVVRHYESQTRGARALSDDAWLMTRRWRDVLRGDPYWSPNLDVTEETGDPDLDKPDGFSCLYFGPAGADGHITLAAGGRVGQRFFAAGPDLAAIVLRVAIDGAAPADAIRFVVRDAPDEGEPLRVVTTSVAGRTLDERWFCFEPIAGSADRFWYFEIQAAEGHTIDVRRANVTSDVMGPCWEHGRPSYGTLEFQAYARAPYRSVTAA